MATGATKNALTLNLSLSLQPWVDVETMVVSEMNDRLSPKKEPPTTTAVSRATEEPVEWAIPAAIGVSATMVPTLVPMDREMKQAATKSPASSILLGSRHSVRLTVASMLPIILALLAKAPARMNIHSISIMLPVPAPRLKVSMRLLSGWPVPMATAKMDDTMKATVMGTL